MKRIVFFGDSVTDAFHNREEVKSNDKYGCGFVAQVAGRLLLQDPAGYEILNKGIGGNRSVDLYARLKTDVINLQPDVVNIFVGINDVWHEVAVRNGISPSRFEQIYRMILEDIQTALPNTKIMMCEPFVGHGFATNEIFERLCAVREYARIAGKLAGEKDIPYLCLQDKFDAAEKKYGEGVFLLDGVHPTIAGAGMIAEHWIKLFRRTIENKI